MLRTLLAVIIGAHGIGHILFLIPLLGRAEWGQSTRSWLFTDNNVARILGGIVWAAVIMGFIAAVYGIWTEQPWWRNAAIIASIISLLGLFAFWTNPASSSAVSALLIDFVVIAVLVIAHWPSLEALEA